MSRRNPSTPSTPRESRRLRGLPPQEGDEDPDQQGEQAAETVAPELQELDNFEQEDQDERVEGDLHADDNASPSDQEDEEMAGEDDYDRRKARAVHDEANISRKVNKRTTFLTDKLAAAEKAMSDYTDKAKTDEEKAAELQMAKLHLEDAKRRYKEVTADRTAWEDAIFNSELGADAEKTKLEEVEKLILDTSSTYVKKTAILEEKIKKAEGPVIDTKLFKIPPVVPRKFTGKIVNYRGWKNNFNVIIGDSENLTPAHKLQHLRNSVEGEALTAISGLGIEDADYDKAWEILDGRYGDDETLRAKLFEELLSEKGPSDFKPLNQRKAHDRIRGKYVKLLELDPQLEKQDSALRSMITKHYSYALRREIEGTLGEKPPMKDFLEEAEKLIRRDVRLKNPTGAPQESGSNNRSNNSGGGQQGGGRKKADNGDSGGTMGGLAGGVMSGGAAGGKKASGGGGGGAQGGGSGGAKPKKKNPPTDNGSGGGAPKPRCAYCEQEGHFIAGCDGFKALSVPKREDALREKKLCFRCTRSGHRGKECQWAKPCNVEVENGEKCGRFSHHRLIHKTPQK